MADKILAMLKNPPGFTNYLYENNKTQLTQTTQDIRSSFYDNALGINQLDSD